MPLADYEHWNEDAHWVWWEEEGKHHDADLEAHMADDFDDDPEFYECANPPQECMEAGNYDHEHDDIWSCSSCRTLFRQVSEDPYVMEPV